MAQQFLVPCCVGVWFLVLARIGVCVLVVGLAYCLFFWRKRTALWCGVEARFGGGEACQVVGAGFSRELARCEAWEACSLV